jgi:hypothetical protein
MNRYKDMDERRACWTISLVAWALRKLCPVKYQEQISEWAELYARDIHVSMKRR